jgi:peptidoglycan/LPS O-acetylase OafA/YrhL
VTGERVASIDGLRGVLALVVLYEHTHGCVFHGHTDAPAQLAVMAFFAISGYVLTRAWDGDFPAFLARRFVRLWPLFALCLAFGAWLKGVQPEWTYFFWYPFVYDPDKSAVLQIDDAMWSLFVEAWAALFMPLIVWCGRSSIRVIAAAAVAMVGFCVDHCFLYAALFVVGAFFAECDFDLSVLNGPVAQWLGRISYSLYLTHLFVVRFCEARWHTPEWLELLLALAAAQVVCSVVERPSIDLSRRAGKAVKQAREALKRGFAANEAEA